MTSTHEPPDLAVVAFCRACGKLGLAVLPEQSRERGGVAPHCSCGSPRVMVRYQLARRRAA